MSSAIIVASRYAIPPLNQYGPGFRHTQGELGQRLGTCNSNNQPERDAGDKVSGRCQRDACAGLRRGVMAAFRCAVDEICSL
jgi:hypothetical protein